MNQQKELYVLIHHLKSCPGDFLELRSSGNTTNVSVALVYDLLRTVTGNLLTDNQHLPDVRGSLKNFNENEYCALHIGVWFFNQPLFTNDPHLVNGIKTFLFERLPALCKYVNHTQWMDDEDRTEEFIREALKCCEIFIDGETFEEAQDRLDALSTLKRQKVLEETNDSVLRMKAIRQAMAEQKAREAANVYGRE